MVPKISHYTAIDPEVELQNYIHEKIQALHKMHGKRNDVRIRKLPFALVVSIKRCLINLYTPQDKAFSELTLKSNVDPQFFFKPGTFHIFLNRLYDLQIIKKISKDKFKLTRKARKIAKTYHRKFAKLKEKADEEVQKKIKKDIEEANAEREKELKKIQKLQNWEPIVPLKPSKMTSPQVFSYIKQYFLKELAKGKEVSRQNLYKWVLKEFKESVYQPNTLNNLLNNIINEVLKEYKTISKIRHGRRIFYKLK
jgi:hypothetical protein